MCWILAPEAQFPGHFGCQIDLNSGNFIKYFPIVSNHTRFTCLLGGTSMCISIMCPKGSISGPRVKVAAELVMPSGLLYTKSDLLHYNIIKWKRILRYCPLVGGIHLSPVDSLHKGTVIRTLDVSVMFVWTINVKQTVCWPVIRSFETTWRSSDMAVLYMTLCVFVLLLKNKLMW